MDLKKPFTFAVRRDRAEMRVEGYVGSRQLRRVPAVPARCSMPGVTGPLAVFDQFWTTFAENYPFFDAKGIDWGRGSQMSAGETSQDARARP
jgi:hypothetical protein